VRHPLLVIENLTTQYTTDHGVVRAVEGLDLRVEAGQVFGIIGESGCGKTTTVLSILRLLGNGGQIVSGSISFAGQNLLMLSQAQMRQVRGRQIAAVFQNASGALNPVLTVGEQIAEGLRIQRGLGRRAAWQQAGELLEQVGITESRKRLREYPHQYSGGMRQRAMLAMAIAGQPRLLLADEPTVALDPPVQVQILDLIERLKDELGMTVLLVTHDLGVAAALCDELAVMYAGSLVEQAPVTALLSDARHPYTQALLADSAAIASGQPAVAMQPPPLAGSAGCRFYLSCEYATELCRTTPPPIRQVDENHSVRCWREMNDG